MSLISLMTNAKTFSFLVLNLTMPCSIVLILLFSIYLFIWLWWVQLRHTGSLIFVAAYRIFRCACGIWFPDQGLNLGPLPLEGGVLATGPPGKPACSVVWSRVTVNTSLDQLQGSLYPHFPLLCSLQSSSPVLLRKSSVKDSTAALPSPDCAPRSSSRSVTDRYSRYATGYC